MQHAYKIVLSGDSGVGKTSLILRFVDGTFSEGGVATLNGEFREKVVDIDGVAVRLQIWDTAGQERYRIITSSFYKNAHGSIVVYDTSNKESSENVPRWMQEVDRYVDNAAKVVIGNKSDLAGPSESAMELCNDQGATHVLASAKTGTNVEDAFINMVKEILQNEQRARAQIPEPEDDNTVTKAGCCALM